MWFVFVAAGVWILQTLLGLWQVKHFNQRFRLLRQDGRVVAGKSKGRFMAGVVVLFCIDPNCNIIKGEKMAGISIFARLKPFTIFNNLNLMEITGGDWAEMDKQTAKAVINAVENYKAFIQTTGEMEVEILKTENAPV
ncbi:glucitol operon activator [Lucifera butyrica]|uniref:Glucitol operon activator n=1 Tax=Lucifera butyrica TaxID=1351585 RepID=A0A498RDF9_9FIRM|nr:transcriptional regulator GutM [Lucifera butyrica]VBB09501.1 glucitol operon activator [Lucifera butyrica]